MKTEGKAECFCSTTVICTYYHDIITNTLNNGTIVHQIEWIIGVCAKNMLLPSSHLIMSFPEPFGKCLGGNDYTMLHNDTVYVRHYERSSPKLGPWGVYDVTEIWWGRRRAAGPKQRPCFLFLTLFSVFGVGSAVGGPCTFILRQRSENRFSGQVPLSFFFNSLLRTKHPRARKM